MLPSLLRWCLPLVLVASACDADDDEQVLRLIDDAIELENDAIAIVCDCWSEAGFDSRGQCLEDQVLPSQRRCVEDAYLRDAEASELYLDCVVPLIDELGTCLDQRLSCEMPSDADPCFSDFDLGATACIDVPKSVQRALDDCFVGSSGGSSTTAPDGGDGGGPAPAPTTDDPGGDTGGAPAPAPEPDPTTDDPTSGDGGAPAPEPEPDPTTDPTTPDGGPAPAPAPGG